MIQIEEILVPNERNVRLFMKREDLLHPIISGNKYRKLKYNLKAAKEEKHSTLLTFGGAFSNHIVAVAGAGKEFGFQTIGIIRGEELETKVNENPSLKKAQKLGMKLEFISRTLYREKNSADFIKTLESKYNRFYLLPEGGTNDLAIKGCEEILEAADLKNFNYICCAVGTGGTLSGIINSSNATQKILGFSSLKGDFLKKDISNFVSKKNWELITEYHFGGYAKVNKTLIEFMNAFYKKQGILLDPIYTSKMMYGIIDKIQTNYFPENARVLAIHTGGLQAIDGMNLKLKQQNKTLIEL